MKVTYDTNVFISHDPAYFPAGFVMSAVVLQELAAGASDDATLRRLNLIRQEYSAEGRLLVPDDEDWFIAGKLLSLLRRGRKSTRKGRVQAISSEEQQRIIRDALIARSAKRIGALVVTENVADFRKLQRYCNVRIVLPADFFA